MIKKLTQLGNVLKEGRKNASLTQQDVADALSVSRMTISAIENGTTDAGISTILKFMRVCKIDMIAEVREAPTIEDIERKRLTGIRP